MSHQVPGGNQGQLLTDEAVSLSSSLEGLWASLDRHHLPPKDQ
jgi:hypothetical protein